MPTKKPAPKKRDTAVPKSGMPKTPKGVQGPFKVVKKRDGNNPVKLY
jgi:hypothetical protein